MACSPSPVCTVTGPSKGAASTTATAAPGREAEPAEVAQHRGVVRDAPNGRRLARVERVQRAQLVDLDVELRVRNRVAVRVVRRVSERRVDPRLELLGQRMLEPVGLVVHRVDRHAERFRQVLLEQPVVADHLDRSLPAGGRQRDTAIRLVGDELQRRELLQHRRDRRR